ncbi:MAG: undecaprenyl-phosphate glucose phosphotransferase [Acidocella sp.]|uniref:undecaprenyl-phosphate glucose phosphotransferase n=1 Tax=Acidocella sp. TaxID=50710 RepID=UPI003FD73591
MTEDSMTRMLFMDTRPEVTAPNARGVGRYLPVVSPHVFSFLAATVDLAVLLAVTLALGTYNSNFPSFFYSDLSTQSTLILLTLLSLYSAGLYRLEVIGDYRQFRQYFSWAWLCLLAALLTIDVAAVWNAGSSSRDILHNNVDILTIWIVTCGLALICARRALFLLFRYGVEQELVVHDAVVIGATALAAQFIARVKADRLGVRVKAVFDDNNAARMVSDVPVYGGIDDLPVYHKWNELDTVVIALPLQDIDVMRRLVGRLSMQPLKIALLPGPLEMGTTRDWHARLGELPGVHLMSIRDLPIERSGLLIKTLFDKAAATLALLLFAPVMMACVIGIKLTSPGPVLFRQKRTGYRNREFNVYKFRSMHVSVCSTGKLTTRNDPRVFAFGHLMRKLSLDELPQLFNVLLGDMSMVGPRPHMPEATAAGQFYFEAVQEYAARHRVKPGITGWAQVNGWRGPTETLHQIEQRVAHDLYYIDNWSFMLDLSILMKTAFSGFFGKNAF